METCPNGCELERPIPEKYGDFYGPGATFSDKIGVEISGVYDGVLFWVCPNCDIAWPRFQDKHMKSLAEKYIRAYNGSKMTGPTHL